MHSWQEKRKLAPHSQQNVFVTAPYSSGSNGGTLERALPYYQCSPGSNPSVKALCRLSLLLVLSLALRGFFPRTLVFPPPQKPMLPNSNLIWNARTRLNEFLRALKCLVGKYIAIYTLCLGLAVSSYIRGVPGGSREAKHDRSSPECCSQWHGDSFTRNIQSTGCFNKEVFTFLSRSLE